MRYLWHIFGISWGYLGDILGISLSERTSGVPPVIFGIATGWLVRFVNMIYWASTKLRVVQLHISLLAGTTAEHNEHFLETRKLALALVQKTLNNVSYNCFTKCDN